MTVLSIRGIRASRREKAEGATHGSGAFRNPCPGPLRREAHAAGFEEVSHRNIASSRLTRQNDATMPKA